MSKTKDTYIWVDGHPVTCHKTQVGAKSFYRGDIAGTPCWWSYDTLIGYLKDGEYVWRENSWGNTTGHHITLARVEAGRNLLFQRESERLSFDDFEARARKDGLLE